jgi:hypothetical protein
MIELYLQAGNWNAVPTLEVVEFPLFFHSLLEAWS